ncbi:FtsZ-interacting cell division protein ZipA [Aquamicrobium lusatiense]|uniref:FtsZ-interacting cell division protein ZipA n=1 Tax=Aquamicrobium lusatiense TaxID=89772 RepID=A0A7W9VWB4_9HYPH|nr:flagellar biosynthetic protein FliO [Aquamicrobium lusatiense]MBB6013125.1 FtsZ-interacting cell division protein ZipA [Aquamicrobium lusatiense]
MPDFLDSAGGNGYGAAIFWVLVALAAFVAVLFIVKMIRSMNFGTFVAGGRNRKTRLAVMDATAVDSHRRLVLVRRDDVEHLILIGGPTDVVVERDIRLASAKRTTPVAEPAFTPQPPKAAPPPQPVQQRQPVAPQPQVSAPARPAAPPPQPRPSENTYVAPQVAAAAPPRPAPTAQHPQQHRHSVEDALDASLVDELTLSLGEPAVEPPQRLQTPDDEMSRLLGELSTTRR